MGGVFGYGDRYGDGVRLVVSVRFVRKPKKIMTQIFPSALFRAHGVVPQGLWPSQTFVAFRAVPFWLNELSCSVPSVRFLHPYPLSGRKPI